MYALRGAQGRTRVNQVSISLSCGMWRDQASLAPAAVCCALPHLQPVLTSNSGTGDKVPELCTVLEKCNVRY